MRILCMWRITFLLVLLDCLIVQQFDYNVSLCGSLWVYPTWSSLSFLYLSIHIFTQIWEFFCHYFLKEALYPLSPPLSSPFSTPIMDILVCLLVIHKVPWAVREVYMTMKREHERSFWWWKWFVPWLCQWQYTTFYIVL